MRIETNLLYNHPEFIEACALWNYNAWGKNSGWTKEQTISGYKDLASKYNSEQAFVALSEGKLVGTALLIENDHEAYKHCRPWLAALYVDSEHRRKGVAKNLVNAVKNLARNQGENRLFLYTESPEVYTALDWQLVETFVENHILYSLMETVLNNPPT